MITVSLWWGVFVAVLLGIGCFLTIGRGTSYLWGIFWFFLALMQTIFAIIVRPR